MKKYCLFNLVLFLVIASSLSAQKSKNLKRINNDILGEFVLVKGGKFVMGLSKDQGDEQKNLGYFQNNFDTVHISVKSFYIGRTEVTQDQWIAIMNSNPSFHVCPSCPVENITRKDIDTFLAKINLDNKRKYRLPTLSEWEYAARGGIYDIKSKYSGSIKIEDVAWYKDNSNKTSQPVAQKMPNELGIYDMSGNLMEFCLEDRYNNYLNRGFEFIKGGCYLSDTTTTKIGFLEPKIYFDLAPEENNNYTGFRLLMEYNKKLEN